MTTHPADNGLERSPEGTTMKPGSPEPLSAGSFKVIYAYTLVNDEGQVLPSHEGRIKVGDATLHTAKSAEELIAEATEVGEGVYTSPATDSAARARIDQQTKTADMAYVLLGSYLAIRPANGRHQAFRDYKVHDVLQRSGVKKKFARGDKRSGEWFDAPHETVLRAVEAVVAGRSSLEHAEATAVKFELRPEQKVAVRKTKAAFKNGTAEAPKDFLWNAIMRFGKTFTTYSLVKELEDVKKVLVLTHRPVVVDGWEEDFGMVFGGDDEWSFASKKRAERWAAVKDEEKFFYFASVQDLRGSFDKKNAANEADDQEETWTESELSEVLTKNGEIFDTEWDLIVFDEAHEGLKTELASRMLGRLSSRYRLRLSGTPFNIISEYTADEIFTWSYIDEQKAKAAWDVAQDDPEHECFTKPNPYASLPELELRTYDLDAVFKGHPAISKDGVYFNFKKFFAVDKTNPVQGDVYGSFAPFKNEAMVLRLLDLMADSKANRADYDEETGEVKNTIPSSFPYANDRAWTDFADTFWVLPSIDATMALHELLLKHPSFQGVAVVNASGSHDSGDPLGDVKAAIATHDRTITLSIGKLTTGTTVPEWTAVFMLSNMKSATLYMQTIFRSKSSGSLRDGRSKDKAYVFDFSPERTLEMVADAGRMNALATAREEKLSLNIVEEAAREKAHVEELLSYLPIIAYDGAGFKTADSDFIMRTLNKIYIEQNVRGGFDSMKLYNREALKKLSAADLSLFSNLAPNVAKATADAEVRKVKINTNDTHENTLTAPEAQKLEKKPKKELTDEERAALEEYRKQNDQVRSLMLILKGVSVRLPLMVLGAPTHDPKTGKPLELTVDNFTDVVDDESWIEFMPKGFKKHGMNEPSWEFLKQYYDRAIFEGSVQALQAKVHEAFELPIMERVTRLAYLLSTFKNPDKETVLTPWKVVNLQYANTLGGLRWVNDEGLARVRDLRTDDIVHVSLEDAVENEDRYRAEPEWVTSDVDPVESDGKDFWEDPETTIFDINSKTALYPLYAAASLYYARHKLPATNSDDNYVGKRSSGIVVETAEDEYDPKRMLEASDHWKAIVENQIFVNCRVPYSKMIAERILRGYDEQVQVNASVVDVLTVRSKLKELGFYTEISEPKVRKNESAEDHEARIDSWRDSDPASQLDRVWQSLFNPEWLSEWSETDWSYPSLLDVEIAGRGWYAVPLELKESNKVKMTPSERAERLMAATSSDDVLRMLDEAHVSAKFTGVVSNPPYQSDTGPGTSKTAIYPAFVNVAHIIGEYVSFIHPVKWTIQGNSELVSEFRKNELSSPKYQTFIQYSDSSSLFNGIGIAGGVCLYLWNSKKSDPTVKICYDGVIQHRDFLADELYIADARYSLIVKKIDAAANLETLKVSSGPQKVPLRDKHSISILEDYFNGVEVFYVAGEKELSRKFVDPALATRPVENYKVMVSSTSHAIAGARNPRPDRIWILGQDQIAAQRFLQVGSFLTYGEAKNCALYMKTTFVGTLLGLLTPTQDTGSLAFTPLVDFCTGEIIDKPGTFLDFTKPETLDDQLAEIYGLTAEERTLMTKDLKPWKDKIDVEADR